MRSQLRILLSRSIRWDVHVHMRMRIIIIHAICEKNFLPKNFSNTNAVHDMQRNRLCLSTAVSTVERSRSDSFAMVKVTIIKY